jgi:hypothetical protein
LLTLDFHPKESAMTSRKPRDPEPALPEESADLESEFVDADPDEGLVRPAIPHDPEHDRMMDPEQA